MFFVSLIVKKANEFKLFNIEPMFWLDPEEKAFSADTLIMYEKSKSLGFGSV